MNTECSIVGVVSDDPFAIDVAHHAGQAADIDDIIAMKRFANTEFCPRFISDERDFDHIGKSLRKKTVIIVSTCCGNHTRNALAMRSFLVARAAKDNGAERVVLIQPDLFYSAQDRGARPEQGDVDFKRSTADYKKFDGQPFSAQLYAQLLQTSGVDAVVTVHNHSVSVQRLFAQQFHGKFYNLSPATLFADYLISHDPAGQESDASNLIICAPDDGAQEFVGEMGEAIGKAVSKRLLGTAPQLLFMTKKRSAERQVSIAVSPDSPLGLPEITGKTVVVFDDMVRTGSTVMECCRLLKQAGAERVLFVVTHFYSSDEVKENLNDRAIDEIVTTNTLPTILNRDMQGRLRKKMMVLKIEKWLATVIHNEFNCGGHNRRDSLYSIDISSKNPRWQPPHGMQPGP